jgi:tetratricopeptide (TPR) repeat protein
MATKENMATAPLMALLLDWVFFSKSVRATLRQRWGLYAGLAATLFILAGLMAAGPRSDSAGFRIEGMTAWDYAASQPLIILHYLRLAVWPHPLCLDYSWPIVKVLPAIAIPAAILAAAVLASLWALWRRPALGFLGAWFFVVLSPTSSFVPMKDLAFEHRMYLPLAAVVVLAVGIADCLIDGLIKRFAFPVSRRSRIKGMVVAVVVGLLCILTMQRNTDYYDAIGMWQDVVAKRPDNARAYVSLGVALGMAGRQAEARQAHVRALEIDPGQKAAQANLGKTLAKLGRYQEAIVEYRKALTLSPNDVLVRYSLGIALEAVGKPDEAVECYREVLRIEPDNRLAQFSLGVCYQQRGDLAAAAAAYREALIGMPQNIEAWCNLAACLAKLGRLDEAVAECRKALQVNPNSASASYVLGNVLLGKGQLPEALDAYRRAVSLEPANADARCNMGVVLGRLGRTDEALACHRETLQRFPRHEPSRFNLAGLLEQQGRFADAVAEYSEVLKNNPGNAEAGAALESLRARMAPGGSN